MAISLFEMKEQMAELKTAIIEDSTWISQKAADPTVSMDELTAKKKHRDDLTARYDMIKAEHDELEASQKEAVKAQSNAGSNDPKNEAVRKRATFYRAVLGGDNTEIKKAYSALGAIPALDADLGNGSSLLPTNMTNELIVEPMVENPMRPVVSVSNITGLEEPKIAFEIDGAYEDVTDKETAKEIKLEGDVVSYGRHKVKVRAKISDTIMHGADLNLVTEIENALRSGLAANEMMRMFAVSPATTHEHMSFFSEKNAIKSVTRDTKQKAIIAALADLPVQFRRNAKIVMSAAEWFDMFGDNLNQSGTFFEGKPLKMFGKYDVILVDDAIEPIVGDFKYIRINYDTDTIYDRDKDVDTGMYKFVLTAWYDIKFRLRSAFRIAKVSAAAAASVNP